MSDYFEEAKLVLTRGLMVALGRWGAGEARGPTSFSPEARARVRANEVKHAGERSLLIFGDAEGKKVRIIASVTRGEARELRALGAKFVDDDGSKAGTEEAATILDEASDCHPHL